MTVFCKLSYLAALLDGEGYVAWTKAAKWRPSRLVMRIAMTDESLIDWLLETFGGCKYSKPLYPPNKKPQWVWSIEGFKAETLYDKVSPLMKIKGKRTEWD